MSIAIVGLVVAFTKLLWVDKKLPMVIEQVIAIKCQSEKDRLVTKEDLLKEIARD